MKKIVFTVIAIALIAALGLTLSACNLEADSAEALNYISIKINPEIELIANGANKVIAVYAANEDAEILLSDIDLLGMDAQKAVNQIIELAMQAGYIVEGSQVLVGVIGCEGNEQSGARLRKRLMEQAQKCLRKKGYSASVTEPDLNQYGLQASKLGISKDKMKMILRTIELDDSLTVEQLKKLKVKELLGLFKQQACLGLGQRLQGELNRERAQLREQFSDMFDLEEEVNVLQAQLKNCNGNEQEQAKLKQELQQRQKQLHTLEEDFNQRLNEAICEKQQEKEQARQQKRAQLHTRMQEHKQNRGSNSK